jgi:hypothetical protein
MKPGFSEGICIAVSPLHCQLAHSSVRVCVCVKKKDYEANFLNNPLTQNIHIHTHTHTHIYIYGHLMMRTQIPLLLNQRS